MEKIELKFMHQKLVFRIEDKEYYIGSVDVLNLLDRQRTQEKFHSLDPSIIYGEWENFDFLVKLEALRERGLDIDEIADYVGTSRKRLEGWLNDRADVINKIKTDKPDSFKAAIETFKRYHPIKKR